MPKRIAWDDCIQQAEGAIEELARLMNRDPLHGELYQQMMAVMMYRKMEAKRHWAYEREKEARS